MLALEQARLDFVDGVMKMIQPEPQPPSLTTPSLEPLPPLPTSFSIPSPDPNQKIEDVQVIQVDDSSVQEPSSLVLTTPTSKTEETESEKPFLKPDGMNKVCNKPYV